MQAHYERVLRVFQTMPEKAQQDIINIVSSQISQAFALNWLLEKLPVVPRRRIAEHLNIPLNPFIR